MKLIAYILIGSLLSLGASRFVEHIDYNDVTTEKECNMDCCNSENDCEDQNQNSESDHSCPPGCNCDCCFHIVAIEYQFLTISEAAPRVYYFGTFNNQYHFDYYLPIFEPPRFS